MGVARQVPVPQARQPKAQCAGTQHGGQQAALGVGQGAHGLVGVQQRLRARKVGAAAGQLDRPVVQGHGQIEQPAVDAGKVEVEEARELGLLGCADEHHVVSKQIGVHCAARQGGVGRAGGHVVLVGQFAAQQRRLRRVEKRQHGGGGVVPPGQAAQVGLSPIVVARRQVRARQHLPDGGAVGRARGELALAVQPVDHRRRLAVQRVQHVVLARADGHAGRLGLRVGHRHGVLGQVLHQVQVKRQLRVRQALEQRQHPFALAGGGEVVGVLDAAFDAVQLGQLAQVERAQQRRGLVEAHFGVDSHVAEVGALKSSAPSRSAGPRCRGRCRGAARCWHRRARRRRAARRPWAAP